MFGRNKLQKEIESLKGDLFIKEQVINSFSSFSRGIDIEKLISKNNGEIQDPIKEVPELAGIINYCGRSYVSGSFQVLKNGEQINNRYEYLFRKPNTINSERTFRMNLAEYLLAYGFCVVYKNQPGIVSKTKSLNLLDPKKTTIKTKVKNLSDSFQKTELKDIIESVEVKQGGSIAKYKDIDNLIFFNIC